MMWTALLSALVAPLAVLAQEQITLDAIHNTTSIQGTWSSGSQHVVTGSVSAPPPPTRMLLRARLTL
jgi:hypothetical protein